MNDYQHRSFPWLEFIGVIVALLFIFGMAAMGAEAGGGGKTTSSVTTVNVLSGNRILSPDTNVYINSGNAPVTGDRNVIISSQGERLCADPNAPGQYNAAACGGQP